MLGRLAKTELELLLTGPSGVGKERYAQYAHAASERSGKFVAVNCGAIPSELIENELFGHVAGAFTGARNEARGLVSEAEGGTLFLDEIDALSARNQVVLLRFLQEKEYRRLGEACLRRADVRIVAASNCDLSRATDEGCFRQDLLFRLRVAPIEIPPLRERPDDIATIFDQYVAHYSTEYRLPPIELREDTRACMLVHGWPGNVRELENCVRFLTCLQLERPVEPCDLPFKPTTNGKPNGKHLNGTDFRTAKTAAVAELERSLVAQALEQTNGNITHAARVIGKPRRTFFELMRKHRITAGK
jgi:DNA-binding NtrC family response regulator